MSKAFIASIIQQSAELTGAAAIRAAGDLMQAIRQELKKTGKFTLPGFGTFAVRKMKAGESPQSAHRRAHQGEGPQDGQVQGVP